MAVAVGRQDNYSMLVELMRMRTGVKSACCLCLYTVTGGGWGWFIVSTSDTS